jgi:hypothetical protein
VADDRVAAAVAELYGADPDAFTERRKALVAAAREAGQRDAAAAIAALRKPTRAAWVVNRLARDEPDAPARLAALAAELRAAEQARDGLRLRELSAARGALIDALTAQALAAAAGPDPPPSLRAEVTATLTAALADPETAAGFAAGALTKAAQWSGFGYADFGPADDSSPDGARSPTASGPAPVDIATRRSGRARTAANSGSGAGRAPVAAPDDRSAPGHPAEAPGPIRLPKQASPLKRDGADAGASADARTARTSARAAAQRATQEQRRMADEAERQRLAAEAKAKAEAEAQRRAREAAERAARAREKYEDAERTSAQASTAAAEAAAVEDGLEAEVRRLEERLTQAREELASARLRARRAEAAERRARQALDQLPRPWAE